jgi:hypothetical protein
MSRLMPASAVASVAITELHHPTAGSPNRNEPRRLQRMLRDVIATAFVARFTVLNLMGAALILAAWAEGMLYRPYAADSSGMC